MADVEGYREHKELLDTLDNLYGTGTIVGTNTGGVTLVRSSMLSCQFIQLTIFYVLIGTRDSFSLS